MRSRSLRNPSAVLTTETCYRASTAPDNSNRFVQAYCLCRRDDAMEDVRRHASDRYLLRTIAPAVHAEDYADDVYLILQYRMPLGELIAWLAENAARDSPVDVVEIRLVEQDGKSK